MFGNYVSILVIWMKQKGILLLLAKKENITQFIVKKLFCVYPQWRMNNSLGNYQILN